MSLTRLLAAIEDPGKRERFVDFLERGWSPP